MLLIASGMRSSMVSALGVVWWELLVFMKALGRRRPGRRSTLKWANHCDAENCMFESSFSVGSAESGPMQSTVP